MNARRLPKTEALAPLSFKAFRAPAPGSELFSFAAWPSFSGSLHATAASVWSKLWSRAGHADSADRAPMWCLLSGKPSLPGFPGSFGAAAAFQLPRLNSFLPSMQGCVWPRLSSYHASCVGRFGGCQTWPDLQHPQGGPLEASMLCV